MAVNFIIKGPIFRTARQLVADGTFPIPQSTLLRHAKACGIGKKAGRNVIFSEADIPKLYQAFPCPSSSSGVQSPHIGSCVGPSGVKALKKAQALMTKSVPKKSVQSAKLKS